MKRATKEDGEFRVRLECRRSSRLSPSIPSTSIDLGDGVEDGLSPIEEGLESIVEFRPIVKGDELPLTTPSPGSGSSALSLAVAIRTSQPSSEDEGGHELALGPLRVSGNLPGGVDSERKEAEMKDSLVVSSVFNDSQEVRMDGGEKIQVHAVCADEVLSSPCHSMLGLTVVSCPVSEAAGVDGVVGVGKSIWPASSLVNPTDSICDSVAEHWDDSARDGGELMTLEEQGAAVAGSDPTQVGWDGSGGVLKNGATVCTNVQLLPNSLDPIVGSCAVGCVREEVRVPQMAGEAMRPQPTDGLWQPPPTSVGPGSESVEKEKGIRGDACDAQEGRGGVQTFGFVVVLCAWADEVAFYEVILADDED
ncbi:hypothetical protein Dimus_030465 [Dionaea muscipula]